MALDHYVSQVHLRQFYAPELGRFMYGIKKSDLKAFKCDSKSVCRIEGNSTNLYLVKERDVEDFLSYVEPNYRSSVSKLRAGKPDQDSIAVIAGFVAFVSCCAPAAMRIHASPLENLVISEALIMDRQGRLPRAPASLGAKTVSELLLDGTIRVKIDKKYPQAVGITIIRHRAALLGNFRWQVLRNDDQNNPFFTSDYPIALEAKGPRFANWIVPLAPDMAVRIIPDVTLSRIEPDPSFTNFSYEMRNPRRFELIEVNRLIVCSAEDIVFYSSDLPWVPNFIRKHRHYRTEAVTERIQLGKGFLNVATQRLMPRPQS